MTQQNVEEEITEEDEEETTDEKSKVGVNPVHNTKEFRERLLELYSQNNNAKETSRKLQEEFETSIIPQTVLKIYRREIVKSKIDYKPDDVSKKYADQLQKRYDRLVKIADFLLDVIEKIRDEFESSDMDKMAQYISFIKISPQINQTLKTVLEQLEYMRKENEKMRTEQKNYIYSPIQINNYLHQTIKKLQEDGTIKIVKKDHVEKLTKLDQNQIERIMGEHERREDDR